MKRMLLLLLLCMSLTGLKTFGQGTSTLHVQDMINFPDTAYEGQTYAFDLVLKNNTNLTIGASIYIYLMVDSNQVIIDSIIQPTLAPQDTLVRSVTNYGFTQPFYKAGNNIVVVWPVVNSSPVVPTDTFETEVFFVPLNSIEHPNYQSFAPVYPNPSTGLIYIDLPGDEHGEDVRIYSAEGRLIFRTQSISEGGIDLKAFPSGVYFIEITSGSRVLRNRFLKR